MKPNVTVTVQRMPERHDRLLPQQYRMQHKKFVLVCMHTRLQSAGAPAAIYDSGMQGCLHDESALVQPV